MGRDYTKRFLFLQGSWRIEARACHVTADGDLANKFPRSAGEKNGAIVETAQRADTASTTLLADDERN